MRKITILEVWDPVQEEYIPLKQAINQGLFNTLTYLFYNPKEDKHYSITEAAQRFMFKSAIDLRPESLIVERVKIAQTVALVSARDPFNAKKILDIVDAISNGIVDTNLRIYRYLNKNEVVNLSEAIDKDLVQVKILKEIHEKITETLTEEKTNNNFGLIKKIETSSLNTGDKDNEETCEQKNDDTSSVHEQNGLFTFDRTTQLNVSKRIKKSDEEFAAGFISDTNSKKLKSILKSSSSPIIDLNEAIRNNLVILPESLILKQNVKYVIDLKSNLRLDYEVACDMGIIDVNTKLYLDTNSGIKLNLFEALKKNYIVMKEELYSNYEDILYDNIDETNLFNKSSTTTYNSNDIVTVFNPVSGEQIPISKAVELGLYDNRTNNYIDRYHTRKVINIKDAAEKGMAVLKSDKLAKQINEGYQFLHINGIINPITKQEMKLNEAIESGLLDYTEGEFHNPDSGQTLTLLEAYDKGYLITSTKNYIPQTPPTTTTTKKVKPTLINTQNKEIKIRKSLSCIEKPNNNKTTTIISSQLPTPPPPPTTTTTTITNTLPKSQSQSPFRQNKNKPKRNESVSSERTNSLLRGRSFDRFSFTSRSSSILSKMKDKLFSKKTKNIEFDENLLLQSIRIVNKLTNKQYDLKSAIEQDLARPDDQIIDTLEEKSLSINDAIKQKIICFKPPQPINTTTESVEYVYNKNCYIYNHSLYLFNYILNPNDQRKMDLNETFEKLIIDTENPIYFGKKGPYSLETAIQKGYISCEIIDLNLLNNIITSNIFKYYPEINNNIDNLQDLDSEQEQQQQQHQEQVKIEEKEQEIIENLEERENQILLNNVPQFLKAKILLKELDPLYNEKGYLSKSILQESGVKFSERRNYIITEVFDQEKGVYLKLKDAIRLGILNEETQEYVDSKTGDVIHVSGAIRKKKIKIANIKKLTDQEFNALFDEEINDFNKQLANTNAIYLEENSVSNNQISLQLKSEEESTQNYAKINETPTVTSNDLQTISNHTNNNKNQNKSTDADCTIENSVIPTNNSNNNFDLIQCLLYKKPTNGKYIRFDRVLKNKLYDYETKQIKDLKENEYITIAESLLRGVLRINDPDILFDKDGNIYQINSVAISLPGSDATNNTSTLAECLKKKAISRKECVLRHPTGIYTVKEAMMKQNLIQGQIITDEQVKSIIDDYYLKYTAETINNKPKIELINVEQQQPQPQQQPETPNQEYFSEFYVFDSNSEHYISIGDAFAQGILIADPIRIKDPNTKSFILLRDAIVKGLVSCEKSQQKVTFKNRSSFYTINRKSYIIDRIYDPKKLTSFSLQDAIKFGLFKNGFYLYGANKDDLSYSIDEAIQVNLILGKRVELDKIDACFKEFMSLPPIKPQRGIFNSRKNSQDSFDSNNKQQQQQNDYYSIRRSTINSTLNNKTEQESKIGKIELVKDVKMGTYLSLNDALEAKIINFSKGLFINTLTMNTIDLSTAIEKGFILMDYQASNFVNRSRSLSSKTTTTQKSMTINDRHTFAGMDESEFIKVGRQFIITSVLDPVNKVHLELEEAIRCGLFDIDCAMYNDPRVKKKLTLVDAIDQGLIRIADDSFQASFKLNLEEEHQQQQEHFIKHNIKTHTIRYVVHPYTKQIVPLNVAVDRNLINLDAGTYYSYDKVISLKEAYEKCLVLTVDDLDVPETKRNKYKVAFVRKSTTGKNMSLKSALAKNWLNFERRIYIDKQTNQEIPFSQAIDMDLLVLLGNFEEKSNNINNINNNNNDKQRPVINNNNNISNRLPRTEKKIHLINTNYNSLRKVY